MLGSGLGSGLRGSRAADRASAGPAEADLL